MNIRFLSFYSIISILGLLYSFYKIASIGFLNPVQVIGIVSETQEIWHRIRSVNDEYFTTVTYSYFFEGNEYFEKREFSASTKDKVEDFVNQEEIEIFLIYPSQPEVVFEEAMSIDFYLGTSILAIFMLLYFQWLQKNKSNSNQ